ncbi:MULTISPECIES: gluconokinase [Rhizobium/Agrobacterium group]|jgi:gluconokinase|uniref:gluconokinase n=1 Tax=Rhizobium/Agrobacterium group TaxID=227290 RepID=UPI000713EFCD|nr:MULTISPECIES: gluconokinase [Rhizobium/Agrobacterium group]KQQ38142.1 gluconokinase [Rhizobium sp. Leaf306]KQQ73754.1 gluconokinase [Rhizobium sp. Leaf321]NSY16279.1 gluconokinase [Neorhizobium sp. AL 9.2.2]SEH23545.1 gluconokinase [Rhizobium sp. NFR12]
MSKQAGRAIIVMGVSGAGKSSVAERLAESLNCRFMEGDSLHPQSNVDKMAQGTPLTDEDRWPWLDVIGEKIAEALARSEDLVVTCSALKVVYRERLRSAAGGKLTFVFLKGSQELLSRRMGERKGHFMPTSLLQSQLATLESPEGEAGVVTVDIDATLDRIVADAVAGLKDTI